MTHSKGFQFSHSVSTYVWKFGSSETYESLGCSGFSVYTEFVSVFKFCDHYNWHTNTQLLQSGPVSYTHLDVYKRQCDASSIYEIAGWWAGERVGH